MTVRDRHFLAFTQRLIDVQRRYPTMIPENVKAVAVADAWGERFPQGSIIDIDSLDPLNRRTANAGHDEHAEFVERDRDYEERGGMKR